MKSLISILFMLSLNALSTEYRWSSNLGPQYTESFARCAKVWELALDNKISFVRDDSNGTIVFKKSTMPKNILGQAIGNVPFAEVRITADIEIGFSKEDKTKVFIDDILTHEIGHTLGLKHSKDSQETFDLETMQPNQVYLQGMLSTLHLKDINRVRKIFGLEEKQPKILDVQIKKKKKNIVLFASSCDENVVWHIQDNRQTYIVIGNPIEIPRKRHTIKAYWNGDTFETIVRPAKIKR